MDAGRRNNVTVTGKQDGPVVMLAHGFGCDQNMWRLITPGPANDFRVVLFDHVGAGKSDLSAWQPERYAALETGHCPQLSAPEATLEAIASFAAAR